MYLLICRVYCIGFAIVCICQTYPLFLTGNEGLEARRHAEAQLVYKRRLVLGMDLNLDPCFK